MRAIRVEVLHLVLFERCAVNCIGGSKSMFKRRSRFDIFQLGLHHSAQITRGVVAKLNYLAGLAFENDNHASSNVRCGNSHETEISVLKSLFNYYLKSQRAVAVENKTRSLTTTLSLCPVAQIRSTKPKLALNSKRVTS